MTGAVYKQLSAYNTAVRNQLDMIRGGEYTDDTASLADDLRQLSDILTAAEPEAIEHMKAVLDDDKTTVHKLHIELESCENFLRDVDFQKRVMGI